MNINIPQTYFSKLMRAVVEFELIDNGDRILIGVSGGKDSIFLTYALAILRERLKKDFTIAAFTVNPQFDDPFDTDAIAAFCKSLDVPYEVVDVDIAGAIAEQEEKSPCFTCAFFRRGAVNRYAVEHKMNKVAYAHHHDDAVETFLMSLILNLLLILNTWYYPPSAYRSIPYSSISCLIKKRSRQVFSKWAI